MKHDFRHVFSNRRPELLQLISFALAHSYRKAGPLNGMCGGESLNGRPTVWQFVVRNRGPGGFNVYHQTSAQKWILFPFLISKFYFVSLTVHLLGAEENHSPLQNRSKAFLGNGVKQFPSSNFLKGFFSNSVSSIPVYRIPFKKSWNLKIWWISKFASSSFVFFMASGSNGSTSNIFSFIKCLYLRNLFLPWIP